MKKAAVCTLAALCASVPAWAQIDDTVPQWRLTLSPTASRAQGGDDPVLVSGSLALERTLGSHVLGVSIGASDGDALAPELLTSTSASSTNGAVWWGVAHGALAFNITLGLTSETLEGVAQASASAPPALAGRDIRVDGDVDTASISASLSRTYGDSIQFTPSLTLGYARTDVALGMTARATPGAQGVVIDQESEGATAALGLDLSGPVTGGLGWSVGGSLVAAEDQAARVDVSGARTDGRSLTRQAPGSAEWGEIYGGLSFAVHDALSLRASLGSTIGLDQEEAWASMAATFSF